MVRAFAFYFPQFHTIYENDLWWSKNFTDWDLVRKARGKNTSQRHPRTPLHGFYDLARPEVIASQALMAKNNGITGFNIYHYWFDGQVLLDKPLKNLHADAQIDIKFMLTWANESWTRQWVGQPNNYLVKQKYSNAVDSVQMHYNYLRTYFQDSRYEKVNGAPVFCIYRPELVPNLSEWQSQIVSLALADGFSGIHFLACRSYDLVNQHQLYTGFSGVINFNPRYALNRYLRPNTLAGKKLERLLRLLPEKIQLMLSSIRMRSQRTTSYDYAAYVACMSDQASKNDNVLPPIYPSVFPDWDNTARYASKATFFYNVSTDLFIEACRFSIDSLTTRHQPWLFINAWNEWSEAAYLEPDTESGMNVLDQLHEFLKSSDPECGKIDIMTS